MILGSMTMRPWLGERRGMHSDGKEGPKSGMRAGAMSQQKVAQTALAQS